MLVTRKRGEGEEGGGDIDDYTFRFTFKSKHHETPEQFRTIALYSNPNMCLLFLCVIESEMMLSVLFITVHGIIKEIPFAALYFRFYQKNL